MLKTGKKYAGSPFGSSAQHVYRASMSVDVLADDDENGKTPEDLTPSASDDDRKQDVISSVTACQGSSLDSTIEQPHSPNRLKLVLDIGGGATRRGKRGTMAVVDSWCQEDWVLLDCYFGIPLFDALVNQQVCQRITSQGLCNIDR